MPSHGAGALANPEEDASMISSQQDTPAIVTEIERETEAGEDGDRETGGLPSSTQEDDTLATALPPAAPSSSLPAHEPTKIGQSGVLEGLAASLQQRVVTLEGEIFKRDEVLKEKGRKILSLARSKAEREADLEKNRQLEEKDSRIAELEAELLKRDDLLTEKEKKIIALENEIMDKVIPMHAMLEDKDKQIAALESEIVQNMAALPRSPRVSKSAGELQPVLMEQFAASQKGFKLDGKPPTPRRGSGRWGLGKVFKGQGSSTQGGSGLEAQVV